MPFLDGSLRTVFGAAFGSLFSDGVLHKVTLSDDSVGGFAATTTAIPVKVQIESVSERDRIGGGLPRTAVGLTVLAAGLASPIALDDSVTVDGVTYRVVQTEVDPAGASFALVGVPA